LEAAILTTFPSAANPNGKFQLCVAWPHFTSSSNEQQQQSTAFEELGYGQKFGITLAASGNDTGNQPAFGFLEIGFTTDSGKT
jgi:hypothetical protein